MNNAAGQRLDIVIPVYNEGANMCRHCAIAREVKTPNRVLICYDRDDDDTLPATITIATHSRARYYIRPQSRTRRSRGRTHRICGKRCAFRAHVSGR